MTVGGLGKVLPEAQRLADQLIAKLGALAAVQRLPAGEHRHGQRQEHRQRVAGARKDHHRQRRKSAERQPQHLAQIDRVNGPLDQQTHGNAEQEEQEQHQSPRGHDRQDHAHAQQHRHAGRQRAQALHQHDIAARLFIQPPVPIARRLLDGAGRRALIAQACAVADIVVAEKLTEKAAFQSPALVAHLDAPAQDDVSLFIHKNGQIAEACPVADQHIEIRPFAAQQIRQVARLHRIRRKHPRGGAQACRTQRPRPVKERQHDQQQDEHRRQPVRRPLGVRAGKIARRQLQRHFQRLTILERVLHRAADHGVADADGHIALDRIALIAAFKARRGREFLRHGDRKIIVLDGPLPAAAEQRQREGLHIICLRDKAGQLIGDRERARAGDAGIACQPEAGHIVGRILFRAVARDLRAADVLAQREVQLTLQILKLKRQRLRHIAGAVRFHTAVGFHRGNRGIRGQHGNRQ